MASLDTSVFEAASTGVGIILFIWMVYKFKRHGSSKMEFPPGPRPWPVVGCLPLLGSHPHRSLASLSKKYGPIMFLRLGSIPTVVVSSPAMAKEFLQNHDLIFSNRPICSAGKYICYDHSDIVFSSYGEHWKQLRKLCTLELLSAKRVESFRSVREEEVGEIINSIWEESGRGERSVNVTHKLCKLTQNIVCRMFSSRTYSDDELSGGCGFKEMLDEIFALVGAFCIGDFIPYLNWLDLQGIHLRMRNVHKLFDEFAEKIIDEHIASRGKGEQEDRVRDLVDVLLDLTETEQEIKITRVHIKGIILDMLNGGTETVATTLEWAMSELLRNPAILARAQEEIESVVGRQRRVRECDVGSFEYLRCIVKETFRLYPVPFLPPHEPREACSVGGYYIAPNTRVMVNLWAIGRDASIWEDPHQFKPERFTGKNIDVRGRDFELLPFGSGRRGCPGMVMGLSNVELALAQLLHCFDWSVEGDPSELNMEESFGANMPRKFPLLATPTWRLTPHC